MSGIGFELKGQGSCFEMQEVFQMYS